MKNQEFSDLFDVLYNNIMSNLAPGLDEYEKSVFLTKALDEIVKAYFNPAYNKSGEGFDSNERRQIDFSSIMATCNCQQVSNLLGEYIAVVYYQPVNQTSIEIIDISNIKITLGDTVVNIFDLGGRYTLDNGIMISLYSKIYNIEGLSYNKGFLLFEFLRIGSRLDDRSVLITFPPNVLMVVNEQAKTQRGKLLTVIPLRYDEYTRLMSKPFKRPLKYQAWRLLNSVSNNNQYAEIITNPGDTISKYTMRYVRRPRPIVLGDMDGPTINGVGTNSECELDPILHEEILQRAVELAKVAYSGTPLDAVGIGSISSTEKGIAGGGQQQLQ